MTGVLDTEPKAPNENDGIPDLCCPFLNTLPVSGVSITVISSSGAQSALCSSDLTAARIDELQFELGEGPQWRAARSGQIASILDVSSGMYPDWPVLGAALAEMPVGAIFAIPMRMGAVTVGAVCLYSGEAGDLRHHQKESALAIASSIASTAVQRAMVSATEDGAPESTRMPALRREVHQATGIILVQLDTSATIAYSRLQAYAFGEGRTVQSVARDVVHGTITFEETPL
jgi:hypothetical protein